jgi:uncharacterized protein (DUF1697 family)
MKTYVALLRGINVGGNRKILMKDLKKSFEEMGFQDVVTYIQSGNVVFKTSSEKSIFLAEKIEKEIEQTFGFFVPVIIRQNTDIQELIIKNNFKTDDIERLHLTFLDKKPTRDFLDKIQQVSYLPDRFEIIDDNVFIFCSGKYSDSKLTNQFFEKHLNAKATTRNWKTILQLAELSKQ